MGRTVAERYIMFMIIMNLKFPTRISDKLNFIYEINELLMNVLS